MNSWVDERIRGSRWYSRKRGNHVSSCEDDFFKNDEFLINEHRPAFSRDEFLKRNEEKGGVRRGSSFVGSLPLHATAQPPRAAKIMSPFSSEREGLHASRSSRTHIIQCTYIWTAHCLRLVICWLARCPLLVLSDGSLPFRSRDFHHLPSFPDDAGGQMRNERGGG